MKLRIIKIDRNNSTWSKLALLSVLGAVASVVALATPGTGIWSNIISRAAIDAFDAESQNGDWHIHLDANGPSDLITQSITLLPGGSSGWHNHPGPAILSVRAGTLTFYEGNDPACTPHVFPAGTGLIERGGDVHIARNEGANAVSVDVTYIVPRDAPQRIDEPSPGNCPF